MKRIITLGMAILLAACASSNVEPPAPLVNFTPKIKVERVWSRSIGSADAILRLGIVPASNGTNVYVASHDGAVYAFNLKNGDHVWRTNTKLSLTAGPGVGEGVLVVCASNGTVEALSTKDGKQLWKTDVNGYVLASPAVSQSVVVVTTTDGHTLALSSLTGQVLWNVAHEVPNLSLRGASPPLISGNTVFQGLDNGQLLALNLSDGSQRWSTSISIPSGSNELARLVDLDGVLAVDSDVVYAVNYHGRLEELVRDSGQVMWRREMSSYTGVSEDSSHVYVTDTHSAVWALDKATGIPVWTQPAMRARDLTLPVPYMDTVVAGDLQGYLHFLSKQDGSIVARVRQGSSPILAPPIVVNGYLVVLTAGASLAAYKIEPLAG
ncbi:MAG: outer membrane protein assembly factor BamB [Gammaproteobacteria bacterium]|nr:outer membrane protein assembly factor BamB [Gammaproteobacteria bacterium]MDE2345633.1 outer membrane protein assembly factor BamB [Gammaproteobacteria bacterium]